MVDTVLNADAQTALFILYEGAREVLGAERLQEVKADFDSANPARPLAEAGSFLKALEAGFGMAGGRGLALRIGRAAFRYGLPLYGERIGFRSVGFRLLPAPRRLESGLLALARLLAPALGAVTVTDEGGHWLCHVEDGVGSDEAPAQSPLCFFVAGLLQEFTLWASGGRFYRVTETQCRASGSPACQYRIEKKPLD